mmetsp:Transcript_28706/g.81120  ORF Transcript_28706/g.81120 Transcript_28706/m.81120 type:complete len:210 (-) Transcript_28706:131-760(-)
MVSCRQRVARGSRGDETRSPHDNSTGLPRRGSSKSSDGMVLREAEKDIFWAELSLACQEKDQKDGSKPRWADIDVEDPLCVAADAVESWPQEGNESPTRVCVVVGRRQLGPRGGRKPKFPAATAAAEPTPAPYCKSSGDPGGSRPDGPPPWHHKEPRPWQKPPAATTQGHAREVCTKAGPKTTGGTSYSSKTRSRRTCRADTDNSWRSC